MVTRQPITRSCVRESPIARYFLVVVKCRYHCTTHLSSLLYRNNEDSISTIPPLPVSVPGTGATASCHVVVYNTQQYRADNRTLSTTRSPRTAPNCHDYKASHQVSPDSRLSKSGRDDCQYCHAGLVVLVVLRPHHAAPSC